jgi:hypothetical protein
MSRCCARWRTSRRNRRFSSSSWPTERCPRPVAGKPISPNAAVNLAKIISKLSPLLGNLIEFNSVEILNDKADFKGHGTWLRQDPGYIVLEPEDTTARTRNLQQTNTRGFKFQGTEKDFQQAEKLVASWGKAGRKYKLTPEYQIKLRKLTGIFKYREDTNYAKMDRIVHPGIEQFKNVVQNIVVHGLTIQSWQTLLTSKNKQALRNALSSRLDIKEQAATALVK